MEFVLNRSLTGSRCLANQFFTELGPAQPQLVFVICLTEIDFKMMKETAQQIHPFEEILDKLELKYTKYLTRETSSGCFGDRYNLNVS